MEGVSLRAPSLKSIESVLAKPNSDLVEIQEVMWGNDGIGKTDAITEPKENTWNTILYIAGKQVRIMLS
jgi:hypothetical protein